MMQRKGYRRIRHPRKSHSTHLRSYKIACANCGKEVVVQVPPPADKKLLCLECFKK